MISSFLSDCHKNSLQRISKLVSGVPFRHSRYQLEHFVVCQKKLSVDMQYKQCLRELQVRHEVVVEKEFEYNDICLKIESFRLDIEQEQSIVHSDPIALKMSQNKIKQLENQIGLWEFRADKLRLDVLDVLREAEILLSLESSLNDKRQFESLEEGEDFYWQRLADHQKLIAEKENDPE